MAQEARKDQPKGKASEAEQATTPEPNVVEMAADRESLKERMSTLESALATLAASTATVSESTAAVQIATDSLRERQGVIERSMEDILRELTDQRIEAAKVAEKERKTVEDIKEDVKETAKDTGNFIWRNGKRAGRRARREVTPGHVNHDHIKGAIIGNLMTYLGLVGAAQVAPVAVGNAVTTALFI